MRDVAIVGVGQIQVSEHWERPLREMAVDAAMRAVIDANNIELKDIDMLVVGNMLGEITDTQAHLGALIADYLGIDGIEAYRVEAACGSGAAAFRAAYMAVAGGFADIALVIGVEQQTNVFFSDITLGLAMAADAEYEILHGASFLALNALLKKLYLDKYSDVSEEDLAMFPVIAHENAVNNIYAMYRYKINVSKVINSPYVAYPIRLFETAPISDGAAAVILAPLEGAKKYTDTPVIVKASEVSTDRIYLASRDDILLPKAIRISTEKALRRARVERKDIDFFELHDAYSIMAALSLEASGFAEPGSAPKMATEGAYHIGGDLPILTMGGLKARGHPVGATGVYQIVESVIQLRGDAGKNQVDGAEIGMAQNVGGVATTVITTILARGD